MMKIAVYGKGGIGKSTISANLSASLAGLGMKVLQVGCDPKHDSTRLLLGGQSIPTVVQYLKSTPADQRQLRDVVFEEDEGVSCVEAGGPEPGIGCAGRGILSAFEFLELLGIRNQGFDIVIYDVLGDVVCGGFAVPLRRGYADAVILVTSGEYMSIFAANNILRGIRNFDGEDGRLLGIVLNARGDAQERERVEVFAEAVHLPIICSIPRSQLFAEAERKGRTIKHAFPESPLAKAFDDLANLVVKRVASKGQLHQARPLSDEDLEATITGQRPGHGAATLPSAMVLGTVPLTTTSNLKAINERWEGATVTDKRVLYGCAFSGAVATTANIRDALTIMHGPRSCSHIITSVINSNAIANQEEGRSIKGIDSNLACSGMGETAMILGGKDQLESALHRGLAQGWPVIFVATTCPSGIMGEDVGRLCKDLNPPRLVPRIIPLEMDGNIHGDFADGVREACLASMVLIDDDVTAEEGLVNIIGEKSLASNWELNFRKVREMLQRIGLRVNCRFIGNTTVRSINDFKKAELNLMAYADAGNELIKARLAQRFKGTYYDQAFPVGLNETTSWLRGLARITGKEDAAEKLIEDRIKALAPTTNDQPLLSGKNVLVLADGMYVDWLLDVLFDLQAEVPKVILGHRSEAVRRSRYGSRVRFVSVGNEMELEREMAELEPDLVLSTWSMKSMIACRNDIIPVFPEVGFDADLKIAKRLARILRLPAREGWREGIRT